MISCALDAHLTRICTQSTFNLIFFVTSLLSMLYKFYFYNETLNDMDEQIELDRKIQSMHM